MKCVAALVALLLAGCSSVTQVCDPAGFCLATWRNVGWMSTVTYSTLKTPSGTIIPGTGSTTTLAGVISYVDPLASGAGSAVSAASDVKSLAE